MLSPTIIGVIICGVAVNFSKGLIIDVEPLSSPIKREEPYISEINAIIWNIFEKPCDSLLELNTPI